MTPAQWQWLQALAKQIPILFRGIQAGQSLTRHELGERLVNGRRVRLSLVAQVVDPGANPLQSHASTHAPRTPGDAGQPAGQATSPIRRRSHRRPKRW